MALGQHIPFVFAFADESYDDVTIVQAHHHAAGSDVFGDAIRSFIPARVDAHVYRSLFAAGKDRSLATRTHLTPCPSCSAKKTSPASCRWTGSSPQWKRLFGCSAVRRRSTAPASVPPPPPGPSST